MVLLVTPWIDTAESYDDGWDASCRATGLSVRLSTNETPSKDKGSRGMQEVADRLLGRPLFGILSFFPKYRQTEVDS